MKLTIVSLAVALFSLGVAADTHKVAVCVTGRQSAPIGGTGFSPSYNWAKRYEVLPDATKCACDMYLARNTGGKWWDTCPDCAFDGFQCSSPAGHIGGDEMNYYCNKKCGAQGSEAD
ncbi:hypothetical protein AAFC00_005035 [Neodothiora populina]|uniref:Uncharacterized protein n=1 Tax=Neodothiora populina TaxID=2781224 RepID=A0ABR3P464_9PEZI